MWKLCRLGLVAIVACGGNGPDGPADARSASDAGAICSVLTQAGCMADQKCTWVLSTDPTGTTPGLGTIACAPEGTAALGAACSVKSVALGGYDNCVAGAVCVSDSCKSICDNNGGTAACGMKQACVTYDGLFANSGSTTVPAGVCDPTCSPLDDNDFDGAGTVHSKTGSACGTSPTTGCYGKPSSSHTTYFTCATPASGTAGLVHRSPVPTVMQFVNSCMSGYQLGVIHDAQGSMQIDCYAWCKPAEAYMGKAGAQAPNGLAPHRCNNTDALGDFSGGIPAGTAVSNGEHCMFSWWFELDHASAVHKSPTSDTLGICVDHTKYQYDANGDTTPDTIWPPCAALPLVAANMNSLGAADLGCVTTATAGLSTAFHDKTMIERRAALGIVAPEFPGLRTSLR